MSDWISVKDQPVPIGVSLFLSNGKDKWIGQPKWGEIITHWSPIIYPTKKRWMPKMGEKFYEINGGFVIQGFEWENIDIHNSSRNFLGVYKTEEEGKEMYDAIAKFVTERIGEP